ncbi:ABC transporter permease [uncultured Mediterranea sp.]|uniref:ABC transporter permease n=1 Tax=uncultured Mediterranea sp. TaxID=1926662 RepID=UPI0027D9B92D|nr:ABC transporter permease [uncultured Mediterranea sp.]
MKHSLLHNFRSFFRVLDQHRFYTAVCVAGTAVTIAFIMVVVMVYDFRTANVAPETRRSRMLYNDGTQCMRPDGTNMWGYRGLGPTAFHAFFDDLPGVDELTWHGGLQSALCALPASSDRHSVLLRPVAANWFDFFRYHFVAGRPFTRSEYDAGRAAFEPSDDEWRLVRNRDDGVVRRFIVISERLARQLFGGASAAVGKQLLLDFQEARVVGVVNDVSSIFQTAYADVWEPFTLTNEENLSPATDTGGLIGYRYSVLHLSPGTSAAQVRAEVNRRMEQLNSQGLEYVLKDPRLYTHTEYTFFRGSSIDARLVYALLLVVLLVVPAVGISGLVHAQMQNRLGEIAIRKAYGASNANIIGHLFVESLGTTLMGGVLGYALSCVLVVAGSTWLFGTGGVRIEGIVLGGDLLLRPSIFLAVLAACFVFNALSTLLPAWMAVRRSIAYTLTGGE